MPAEADINLAGAGAADSILAEKDSERSSRNRDADSPSKHEGEFAHTQCNDPVGLVFGTAVATHALAAERGGSGIGAGNGFQNNRGARELINEKQLRGHLARIEGARQEARVSSHVFAGVTNPREFPVVSQEQQS